MSDYKTVSETSLETLMEELAKERYNMEWFSQYNLFFLWNGLYGERLVNPAFMFLVDLKDNGLRFFAEMIKSTYEYKWRKLWETTKIDYNPIINHDMADTKTRTTDGTASGSNDGEITTYTSPFNTEKLTMDGANRTTNTSSTTTKNSENETITHTGLAGDSVQSLLRDERITANFSFYSIVLQDIADLLTLSIY